MIEFVCDFSIPLDSEGNPPSEGEYWGFSHTVCSYPVSTILQNTETGAEFYLQKSMSYGDILLITFLSIFLIFGIFKFLWNFIWQNLHRKL